ncbi:MAG TPA: hypothetical protein VFB84_08645 [Micromonosporaceae bacterium]|nr:hypothetical protein [Micromonosporaceae bacterium]
MTLLAVAIGWNVTLFTATAVRRRVPSSMVWADVALVIGIAALDAAVLGAVSAGAGDGLACWSWPTHLSQAAAVLAAATLYPVTRAATAVLVLLGGHAGTVLAARPANGLPPPTTPTLLTGLLSIAGLALVLGLGAWYLRRQGRALDEAMSAHLEVEAREAAEHASTAVVLAHRQALHDTVLSTMTAIARGGLDHRTAEVRHRCAQEAEHLRRLLSGVLGSAGVPARRAPPAPCRAAGTGHTSMIEAELAEVVGAAEALGLRVHYRLGQLPDLPPDVVDALCGAAREGLNNVLAHSGDGVAWLTALSEDHDVVVRVVDRGCGFDPTTAKRGFGLVWSVEHRMRAVGGSARVTSGVGDGTCLELRWRL